MSPRLILVLVFWGAVAAFVWFHFTMYLMLWIAGAALGAMLQSYEK